MSYPRTNSDRAELRAQLETDAVGRARAKARETFLSIRCNEGDHGCLNSGAGCLCACHDAEEQQ